jgi:hypothetical protein
MDHGGSMSAQIRITPHTSKKILAGGSRLGIFSEASDPHPLLAPLFSALAGLTFFFVLMFCEITLLTHIF